MKKGHHHEEEGHMDFHSHDVFTLKFHHQTMRFKFDHHHHDKMQDMDNHHHHLVKAHHH